MSKEQSQTINPSSQIYTILANNLKKLITQKKLSQLSIVTMCKEKGYKITQGTVSNVLRGRSNVTLGTIIALADVLETDVPTLLTPARTDTTNYFSTLFSNGNSFITSPKDAAFQGYLGEYSILFYKTSGKTNDLLQGTLKFKSSADGKRCEATLILPTGDYKTINNEEVEIKKEYTGELVISKVMHSVYILLYSENIGELSLLIFHHWYILNNSLKCAVASAITTSSGSNRRPTVQRACIVQGNVSSKVLPFIKGQLLLNDADIIISHTELSKLFKSSQIPQKFRELIRNAISKERYYMLKENLLIDTSYFNEAENTKWISYVRYHSVASKYNKISKRTDDSLYSLLFKNKDNV